MARNHLGLRSIRWGTFLTVLLWNTCGYDSAGTVAAEVGGDARKVRAKTEPKR